jgi:Na+-translocating ferredoxin:NAD+ oxidoreductase RnfA subunit
VNDKNLLSLLTLCPFVPTQKQLSAVGKQKDRKTEGTEGFFTFVNDKNLLSLLTLCPFVPTQKQLSAVGKHKDRKTEGTEGFLLL